MTLDEEKREFPDRNVHLCIPRNGRRVFESRKRLAEGRMISLIFWRFQLPEEEIEPLTTEVVPFASL